MTQSINRPEMQIARNRMTKDYMQDFFDRNLTRPTMEKFVPQYLKPFKIEEEDDPHELFE